MKSIENIRRIDELGRIVIPKGIRKAFKIREGDQIEIYTDNDDNMIFKRYSPITLLVKLASDHAESLYKASGYVTCISDKDDIIAASSTFKKDFVEKQLSPEVKEIISKRNIYIDNNSEVPIINDGDNIKTKYFSRVITPIIVEGDVVGSIIMFSLNSSAVMGSVEVKLTQVTADFLEKQLE